MHPHWKPLAACGCGTKPRDLVLLQPLERERRELREVRGGERDAEEGLARVGAEGVAAQVQHLGWRIASTRREDRPA